MTPGDGPQGVPQGEVPSQVRLAEFRRPAAPIVGREARHPLRAEPVRQQPRLHRAVHDHPGAVRGAPGEFARRRLAADERERRLQRVHVADRLAALEQRHVEVRHARRPHFALLDEAHHRPPGVFHGRSRLVGPVKLVEINALHPEAPQRGLELATQRPRLEHPARLRHGIPLVPHQAPFGEHQRPLARGQGAEQSAHELLGVPEAVHRRGVDPIDPQLQRAPHRGERTGVVLRSPAERPASAADGPGSEAHGRDLESARAERTGGQRHARSSPLKESTAPCPRSPALRARGAPRPPARAGTRGRCAASACPRGSSRAPLGRAPAARPASPRSARDSAA